MKKISLILFSLGYGVTLNLVGTISVSELFLLLYFLYIVFRHQAFLLSGEMRMVTTLYTLLLATQVFSEVIVGNTIENAAKGFATTIVSYSALAFYVRQFLEDRSYIAWLLIGAILKNAIFPSLEGSAEEALAGTDAIFLKFVLAAILTNSVLIYSVWRRGIRPTQIMMALGLFLVVAGARSSGGIAFATGALAWFIMSGRTISRRKVMTVSCILILVSYGLYCIYVSEVLSGRISSGNSEQAIKVENPYNPINLLREGRSETFVGWIAFLDRPFFGFGAWAPDPGFKYHIIMTKIKEETHIGSDDINIIPAHSVIIGTGVNNGILAVIAVVSLILFFLKRGSLMLGSGDRYLLIIISYCISIVWSSLFSPVNHLRATLPIEFAFILVSYMLWQQEQEELEEQEEDVLVQ